MLPDSIRYRTPHGQRRLEGCLDHDVEQAAVAIVVRLQHRDVGAEGVDRLDLLDRLERQIGVGALGPWKLCSLNESPS
jgi:hypothetical protein